MASASPFKEALDVDEIIQKSDARQAAKVVHPEQRKNTRNTSSGLSTAFRTKLQTPTIRVSRKSPNRKWPHYSAILSPAPIKTARRSVPILVARPKAVGDHIRKALPRAARQSVRRHGPSNKDLAGKYTSNVDAKDGTKGQFTGAGFRIKAG